MACKHVCCNKTDDNLDDGLVIRIKGEGATMDIMWAIESTLVDLFEGGEFEGYVNAKLNGSSVYSVYFEVPRHDILVKGVKSADDLAAADEVYNALNKAKVDFECTEIVY